EGGAKLAVRAIGDQRTNDHAESAADCAEAGGLDQEERANLGPRGAERAQDSDVTSPPLDADGEHVEDQKETDRKRQHAHRIERSEKRPRDVLQRGAALIGRPDSVAGSDRALDVGEYLVG